MNQIYYNTASVSIKLANGIVSMAEDKIKCGEVPDFEILKLFGSALIGLGNAVKYVSFCKNSNYTHTSENIKTLWNEAFADYFDKEVEEIFTILNKYQLSEIESVFPVSIISENNANALIEEGRKLVSFASNILQRRVAMCAQK